MIDRTYFFANVRDSLFGGVFRQDQVDGLNVILDAWEKWQPGADLRFVAYSLATVFWETARTMLPVREVGEGRGEGYGKPTGPYHQIYYGRGLVQLTWESVYDHTSHQLKLLNVLGPDDDLVKTPDLALRSDVATAILVFGMSRGWFTGKKLSDYFGVTSDWSDARKIINGEDHAGQIAVYGHEFFAALRKMPVIEAAAP